MIHELHFFFNNGSSIVDIPIENIFSQNNECANNNNSTPQIGDSYIF